jgi:5-methylcytosine-specific restriction protein A
MHWTSQSSGVTIPTAVASELERVWGEFTNQPVISTFTNLPEEIEGGTFREGTVKQIVVNAYERNPEARLACLKRYGTVCSVCGFDFKKVYGDIGEGYIHVHHLRGLSQIGKEYELDPYADLRPVCPNCHAMLHKRKPVAYTIDEMKWVVEERRRLIHR